MRTSDPPACSDILDYLDDYIDEELGDDIVNLVDTHLRLCKSCATRFESARVELLKLREQAQNVIEPPDLFERVIKRLRRND